MQNALRILTEVARAGEGVTARDIAVTLAIPPATVYRLLTLLIDDGFVLRRPDRPGFALGHKVAALANTAVRPTLFTAARDLLTELRKETPFGVHLYSYTATAVRQVDPDPECQYRSEENYLNQHLHASAVGKLILAEHDVLDSTFQPRGPQQLTARTIHVRSELRRHLNLVRDQGYATQVGELRNNSACLSVPIRSTTGTLVAGLALSGHIDHFHLIFRHLDALQQQAAQLAPLLS
ncbi:helix-turn-helix domain-containing protein [Rhodococcus koreensis]|nr:helix-turn-helix domain-containing protein [Rhodococcus koreensis]